MSARLAFVYGSREMLYGGIYPYLSSSSRVVRETLAECERLVEARLGWSLKEALSTPGPHAPQDKVEPALTAVQIALTRAWHERGIRPDAIAGRSGGEFAAEYARGTLPLESAIEVACRWSRLQHARRGAGTMLTIHAGLEQILRLQQASPAAFFTVADSADDVTVVSCAADDVAPIAGYLAAQGVRHERTGFTCGPHSPLIDGWKEAFVEPLVETRTEQPAIPYYSAGAQAPDHGTSYAVRMWQAVRSPALFGRTLSRMIDDGCNVFLEIGGRPTIAARTLIRRGLAQKKVAVLPTMLEREPANLAMDETQIALAHLGVGVSASP